MEMTERQLLFQFLSSALSLGLNIETASSMLVVHVGLQNYRNSSYQKACCPRTATLPVSGGATD